jgi:hypothetical protein
MHRDGSPGLAVAPIVEIQRLFDRIAAPMSDGSVFASF